MGRSNKPPRVQYRVLIGSGQGREGMFRGAEDKLNMAQNIDDWVNTALARYLRSHAVVDVKAYERSLQKKLTMLFMAALDLAANSMVGTPMKTETDAYTKVPLHTAVIDKISGEMNSDATDRTGLVLGKQPFFKNSLLSQSFANAGLSDKLSWKPLSPATLKAKARRLAAKSGRRGNQAAIKARRHYIDTGALRTFLRQSARSMVRRTGVVRITGIDLRNKLGQFTSIKKVKKVELSQVRVRYLPNVGGMLPGLTSGSSTQDSGTMGFEQALGISGENLKKLQGSQLANVGGKRPLLQPVFTYYALFRAPAIVAAEAERIITGESLKKNKGSLQV